MFSLAPQRILAAARVSHQHCLGSYVSKRGAKVPTDDLIDVEWINAAAKPTQLALPPRRAATLAVDTARAIDQAVATLSDELLAKNVAAGTPINVRRAEHRREHLDEIEKALGR